MGPFRQEGHQEFHLDIPGLKCLLSTFLWKTVGIQPGSGTRSRLTEPLVCLHPRLTTTRPVSSRPVPFGVLKAGTGSASPTAVSPQLHIGLGTVPVLSK